MLLRQRFLAEFLGTLALLAIVVGSGIMGARLAAGNDALALLANAGATAAGLYLLIVVLGPISGAHFNPAVTLGLGWVDQRPRAAQQAGYLVAQLIGAVIGVWLAHAMFGEPLWQPGTRVRSGASQWLSEMVATCGLLLTILLGRRFQPGAVPGLVACWIFAAYWFTASTSFANPAVTLARTLTRTFAGIQPADAPAFIAAQLIGAAIAVVIARLLLVSSDQALADHED